MDHAPLTTASFAARIAALLLAPDAGLFDGVRIPQPPLRRHTWQSPQAQPLPPRAELTALLVGGMDFTL